VTFAVLLQVTFVALLQVTFAVLLQVTFAVLLQVTFAVLLQVTFDMNAVRPGSSYTVSITRRCQSTSSNVITRTLRTGETCFSDITENAKLS